jgi:hypothetical protein
MSVFAQILNSFLQFRTSYGYGKTPKIMKYKECISLNASGHNITAGYCRKAVTCFGYKYGVIVGFLASLAVGECK